MSKKKEKEKEEVKVFKSSLINGQFLYEICHYFRKTKKKKIESRKAIEKNRTNPRNPRNKIVKYTTPLIIFYHFLKKEQPKSP